MARAAAEKELRVSLDDKIHAFAQPFQIRARGHAGEGCLVELPLCGLGECDSRLLSPLDTAGARQDLPELQDFAGQSALARTAQKISDPGPVRRVDLAECVREHDGPLSLQQIAIDLLAVPGDVAGEVEDVVGDLERSTKQKSEPVEAIELPIVSIGDKRRRSASDE